MVLSQWDQAVQLAQQHNIPQVQALLLKYAAMLLDQGKTMAAVQLYRKVSSLDVTITRPGQFCTQNSSTSVASSLSYSLPHSLVSEEVWLALCEPGDCDAELHPRSMAGTSGTVLLLY